MGVGGPFGFSDLMFVMNTKYYILLLTSGKWDGEDIAVLGKVLYSNGWIFRSVLEDPFFQCMLFSFLPRFSKLAFPLHFNIN